MQIIDLVDLLKAGAHFGHQKSKMRPRMKPYVFGDRNGISIINLSQTKKGLEDAASFLQALRTKNPNSKVLFVGTKKQAAQLVRKQAEAVSMPYINSRWLGGTFTNFKTILKSIKKLKKLIKDKESEDYNEKFTKKEKLMIDRQIKRKRIHFGGLQSLDRLPEAIFVVDTKIDKNAISESLALKIPIIAICDTNSDPSMIDFPIPANDDAARTIDYILKFLAQALQEVKTVEEPAKKN